MTDLHIDGLGRQLRLAQPPQRIVSLVPSQTELLFDLGLDAEIVGVTKFCLHPSHARTTRTRVGGTKTLMHERIHALAPDLIVANREENRREDIEALQALAPCWVSDVRDLPDALAMIRSLGLVVGRAPQGAALAARIEADFAALPRLSRRVAYLIWRDPWMVAGGDTFIDDLLGRLGLHNVFADQPRYPALDDDTLREAAPELLFLSSEPYPFRERHAQELATVCPGAEPVLVDGEMFCWFGSRLQHSASYFRQLATQLQSMAGGPND